MRFVFASDSFKGSLNSKKINELLTRAAKEVFEDAECIGIITADGGEGTVEAVVLAVNGRFVKAKVHDPLGKEIEAVYGIIDSFPDGNKKGSVAVIETAAASGLTLLKNELRDAFLTSTYGTGELIKDALCRGITDICIGLGGSATNDGGMGALRALGAKFVDKAGNELKGCGNDLERVCGIDLSGLDERLSNSNINAMSDVTNPLCGKNGATHTFGPQKCSENRDLERLEKGMQNYKEILKFKTGTDPDKIRGAGAAGGLGAALVLLLHAKMRSGIETVLELSGFDEKAAGACLVITGEGRLDSQSLNGKTVQGVAARAKKLGVPVYAICGSDALEAADRERLGLDAVFTLQNGEMPLKEAMERAEEL